MPRAWPAGCCSSATEGRRGTSRASRAPPTSCRRPTGPRRPPSAISWHSERPDDGLLGEEGSERAGRSGRRWVVDPLDGTINYLYGFPAWCVSVALEDADGGLVGVIHDPLRDETFCAERGAGCTLNGRSGRVSAEERLDTALIGTGFSYEAGRASGAGRAPARRAAAGARRAPGGSRRAGSRLGGRGAARRLLRARPQALGLGGGSAARHGGGRRRGRARAGDPPGLAAANAPLLAKLLELVARP